VTDRYAQVRLIRRGAAAEVFEARAHGLSGFERRVALKVLLPDASALARTEFEDEARLAAQFHHPHVVAAVDYLLWESRPCQALEWVDGLDLDALMQAARGKNYVISVSVAMELARDVALGLDYAHTLSGIRGPLGIVHRDVSPGNILVSWSGQVRLTDFGVAQSHEREGKTRGGWAKGTPAFMAPEQWIGDAATPRTDVFSLGCVLAWMLTGESPMAREDVRTRAMHGESVVLPSDLPPEVLRILERALAANPERRYGSAKELAEALGRERRGLETWLKPLRPATAVHPVAALFLLGGMPLDATEDATRIMKQPGEGQDFSDRNLPTVEWRRKAEPETADAPALASGWEVPTMVDEPPEWGASSPQVDALPESKQPTTSDIEAPTLEAPRSSLADPFDGSSQSMITGAPVILRPPTAPPLVLVSPPAEPQTRMLEQPRSNWILLGALGLLALLAIWWLRF